MTYPHKKIRNMKNENSTKSSGAALRAASAKFILTGMIAAAASLALPTVGSAQISAQPFFLDGLFTNGFTPAGPVGEWSDVTPFAFISTPGGTTSTALSNPAKNTLLYAAISHNVASAAGDLQLHLMYDFLPRTTVPLPGETFASVTFPVTLQGRAKDNISVVFKGAAAASGVATSFFDIFVDLDVADTSSPLFPLNSAQFPGLLGAVNLGGSSLSPAPHLLVELEVPLRIPAGFATPPPAGTGLPGGGINPATGMYDPNPVFWGAAAGGDGSAGLAGKGVSSLGGGLQDATQVIIGISPTGSLNITPAPEPTSAVLLLGTLGALAARRRRSA